jgi:hypothetical protein
MPDVVVGHVRHDRSISGTPWPGASGQVVMPMMDMPQAKALASAGGSGPSMVMEYRPRTRAARGYQAVGQSSTGRGRTGRRPHVEPPALVEERAGTMR